MDLKEIKCKNCRAQLNVNENEKEVTCSFCGATFMIETIEDKSYQFEKGKLKAQHEEMNKYLESFGNMSSIKKTFKIGSIMIIIINTVAFIAVISFFIFLGTQIFKDVRETHNNTPSISTSSFNLHFESYAGSNSKFFTGNVLDQIVKSNNKNDRKILLKYNEIETDDVETVKQIRNELNREKYYISFEYDKDGYINKIILEDI